MLGCEQRQWAVIEAAVSELNSNRLGQVLLVDFATLHSHMLLRTYTGNTDNPQL